MTGARDSILPLLAVLIPAACAGLALLIPQKRKKALSILAASGAGLSLLATLPGFFGRFAFERAWAYWEMDFSLATSALKAAFLTALAAIALFRALRALKAPQDATRYGTALPLLTIAMAYGAVLSENLVAMLFFWQAMWLPVYAMILLGGESAPETPLRALATLAVTDLCLMFGIGLLGRLAHSLEMTQTDFPPGPMATAALALMAVGALGRLGVFPFHGWRYRARGSAPVFGAADILLGGYLLIRLSELFAHTGNEPVDIPVAVLGILSMLLALVGFAKRRSAADIAAFVGGAVAAVWMIADEPLLISAAILGALASCAADLWMPARAAEPLLDPCGAAEKLVKGFSIVSLKINDGVSWVYDRLIPAFISLLSRAVRGLHNGSHARYVIWVLAGAVIVAVLYRFS